jgi:hypothetical protein
MLRAAWFRHPRGRARRRRVCASVLGAVAGVLLSGRAALAGVSPILAQESSSEGGGYAIIEWAIVVVFTGVALFVICRSSRRN